MAETVHALTIERHAFAEDLRKGVDSPEGWMGLLQRYADAM